MYHLSCVLTEQTGTDGATASASACPHRAFCSNVSRQWTVLDVLVTCAIYKQQRMRQRHDSVIQHCCGVRLYEMSLELPKHICHIIPLYMLVAGPPKVVASSSGLNLTPSLPWLLDIYYHNLPCQCCVHLLKHMCVSACSQTQVAALTDCWRAQQVQKIRMEHVC